MGRIAAWITGAAWAIATFFVIPVVALEGTGPWSSLKRSAAVVKARWGEGATGAATIAVVTVLFSFLIMVVGALSMVALLAANQPVLGFAVLAIAAVSIIGVSIVSSTLGQIFRVAVYQYAVSGETPGGFDGQLLQAAFERHAA